MLWLKPLYNIFIQYLYWGWSVYQINTYAGVTLEAVEDFTKRRLNISHCIKVSDLLDPIIAYFGKGGQLAGPGPALKGMAYLKQHSIWMAIFSPRLNIFKIAFQGIVNNSWGIPTALFSRYKF